MKAVTIYKYSNYLKSLFHSVKNIEKIPEHWSKEKNMPFSEKFV